MSKVFGIEGETIAARLQAEHPRCFFGCIPPAMFPVAEGKIVTTDWRWWVGGHDRGQTTAADNQPEGDSRNQKPASCGDMHGVAQC